MKCDYGESTILPCGCERGKIIIVQKNGGIVCKTHIKTHYVKCKKHHYLQTIKL